MARILRTSCWSRGVSLGVLLVAPGDAWSGGTLCGGAGELPNWFPDWFADPFEG